MDHSTSNFIAEELRDIEDKCEIVDLLRGMTYDVEAWERENVFIDTLNALTCEKAKSRKQNHELQILGDENIYLKEQIASVRKKSCALKDRFIMDIGSVLRESKRVYEYKKCIESQEVVIRESHDVNAKLQKRLGLLEDELALYRRREQSDKLEEEDGGKTLLNLTSPSSSCPYVVKTMAFLDLDDTLLLTVFSFLDTLDVICAAQVCKALYARVDVLFGMEGTFCHSEFQGFIHDANHITLGSAIHASEAIEDDIGNDTLLLERGDNSHATGDKLMTEIDELSKKLSGRELQLIISMTDRMKGLMHEIEISKAEKEGTSNFESTPPFVPFFPSV